MPSSIVNGFFMLNNNFFHSQQIVHYPVHIKVDKPVPYEVKGETHETNKKLVLRV